MRAIKNPFRVFATAPAVLWLGAVICVQNFLPTEISSPLIVLLGLSVLVVTRGKIKRSYLKLTWPLMGVLVTGIVGFGHQLLDILRDVSYALTPISLMFIGFWAADNKKMWSLIFKIVTICGFVFAIVHLTAFVQSPELLSASVNEVRDTVGPGSGGIVVLSLVLGLFQNRLGLESVFPRFFPRLIVLPVLMISFVLSYSRTEFIVFIMLSLTLLGWLTPINWRLVGVIVLVLVGFVLIAVTTPASEEGTFRSKLAMSMTELVVSNYEDLTDINEHWRGFETYRALVTFLSGSVFQQVFGQGFGALVDLGFVKDFGKVVGVQLQYIPILHNGYAYVLIKTGLLGLVLYATFYINVIRFAARSCDENNKEQRFLARLLLGCVLSLILVMYVVGGMAETAEPALVLLLGYSVRRISQFRTDANHLVNVSEKE